LKQEILRVPRPTIEALEEVEPIYESIPGWNRSTKEAASLHDLPKQARHYLDRIVELVGVPLSLISVGPERHRTIMLKDFFS